MMMRSLWRGLGRNTPAPKRSMSNRPAPVAIISMAQHARPKVMGHSADLRAQLTTGAAMSTVFAPTVRRIEFMIESTVVRTNPSSCSAIRPKFNSRPLERALPPCVIISNDENRDEHKHFDERKLRKREVVAHEDYGPGQQENRFDVENEKQHRDDVIAHGETLVSFGRRIDTALVRPHLVLLILDGSQKSAENNGQHGKDHGHGEKDHYRPVGCDRAADILSCSRCCLKKHSVLQDPCLRNSKRRVSLLSTNICGSVHINVTSQQGRFKVVVIGCKVS